MGSLLASTLTSPWVTNASRMLHENKTWKALGVEVLGINLPKTVIVRTKDEALDVGVNEFGNTIGFFGGMWGLGHIIDKVLVSRRVPLHPNPAVISKGRVMKSFALIPPLVAFMVAMPFFRNAFTAWHAGTVDYKDLVTKSQRTGKGDSVNREKTSRAIREFMEKGTALLLAGISLGALGFLWARSRGAVKLFQGQGLVPFLNKGWVQKALKAVCLTGKKGTEFEDLRAVFYWGIPAYLGWMAAARDGYEVKEQLLKMVNFILVYMLPEKIMNRYFEKKSAYYAQKLPQLYIKKGKNIRFSYALWKQLKGKVNPKLAQEAVRLENTRLVSGFAVTVALMAALPALLNIYLTKRRIQNAEAKAQALPRIQPLSAVQQRYSNGFTNLPLENISYSSYSR